MPHSTLCARALLDRAIQERNNRFFVKHFGKTLEQYSLTDYAYLLKSLSKRMQVKILNHLEFTLDEVPPAIRDLFQHGATIENVHHFYPLPLMTLQIYREVCAPKKVMFRHKYLNKELRSQLAFMSRNIGTLTALDIVQLSQRKRISVRRLMAEIVGELR